MSDDREDFERQLDALPTLAERLLAIGRDCAKRFREPYRSIDHGDLLYDSRGLPREDQQAPTALGPSRIPDNS